MLTNPAICIGDTARFPLGRLGDDDTYRHRWMVESFALDGCVTVRRLADGARRTMAAHWFERYTLDERPRARVERRALPLPRLNSDRARPGFYVSVRHVDHTRHVLAAGPFSYPGDAERCVRAVRVIVNRDHGASRDWWSLSIGTCKAPDGALDGRWNSELGLVEG